MCRYLTTAHFGLVQTTPDTSTPNIIVAYRTIHTYTSHIVTFVAEKTGSSGCALMRKFMHWRIWWVLSLLSLCKYILIFFTGIRFVVQSYGRFFLFSPHLPPQNGTHTVFNYRMPGQEPSSSACCHGLLLDSATVYPTTWLSQQNSTSFHWSLSVWLSKNNLRLHWRRALCHIYSAYSTHYYINFSCSIGDCRSV